MAQLIYHDINTGRYLIRQPDGTFVDYKPIHGSDGGSSGRDPGDPIPTLPPENSGPQIGDRGSDDIRKKEHEQRMKEINARKGGGSGSGKNEPMTDEEAADEAGNIRSKIKGKDKATGKDNFGQEGSNGKSGNGEADGGKTGKQGSEQGEGGDNIKPGKQGKGDTKGEGGSGLDSEGGDDGLRGGVGNETTYEKELTRRVNEIQRMFDDPEMARKARAEAQAAIDQEKKDKETARAEREANSPRRKFEASLTSFVKRKAYNMRTPTMKKFNKTYVGSGIIKPGRQTTKSKEVPHIEVYLDCSSSWTDDMLNVALDVIGTLNAYVKRQEVTFNVRYFSDHVHSSKAVARSEGSTGAGPEIWDEIRSGRSADGKHRIENVIILTDDDIDSQGGDTLSLVTVPGAVWLLFMNKKADTVIANIKAEAPEGTQIFMLDRGSL